MCNMSSFEHVAGLVSGVHWKAISVHWMDRSTGTISGGSCKSRYKVRGLLQKDSYTYFVNKDEGLRVFVGTQCTHLFWYVQIVHFLDLFCDISVFCASKQCINNWLILKRIFLQKIEYISEQVGCETCKSLII